MSKSHNERCKKCKERILEMLKLIYGEVEQNHKFNLPITSEGFKDNFFYKELSKILISLQNQRGHKDFVGAKNLPRVDFFIPNPGFILEFDESQHFTELRKISLENYPKNVELGFDKQKWINLCKELNKKDNDPIFRDEQRAWYDTLRDFVPSILNLKPTIRLFAKDFAWCSLNPREYKDIKWFKEVIEGLK